MTGTAERSFLAQTLLALGGLIAWAAHFTAVYAFTATVCARGLAQRELWGVGLLPLGISGATAVAAAATLVLLAYAALSRGRTFAPGRDGRPARFLRATTMMVAVLALVAIVWQGLFVLLVPVCG